MKKSMAEVPCLRDFRERLGEMGFDLEVRPTPRQVSIVAVNTAAPPRFRMEFSPGSTIDVRDTDPTNRMALVGLLEPSGESGLFLIGQDEALFSQSLGQRFTLAQEQPQQPRTVAEALEALTPEEVRKAIQRGLKVLRQGDIWFVPVELGPEASILGTRHSAERTTTPAFVPLVQGWIRHPEHKAIFLDCPHWAYSNLARD